MKQRKAKKSSISRDYLMRSTYNYLQRFATTERNLRTVLERKVIKRLPEENSEEAKAEALCWIDDIIQKAVDQNLVNDRSFAESRATSLIRSGNSLRQVSQKLRTKGVSPEIIEDVIDTLREDHSNLDLLAAVKYTRKRRFGAFSIRHDGSDIVDKELASMCRAGFSYALANKVLKMSLDVLEDILFNTKL